MKPLEPDVHLVTSDSRHPRILCPVPIMTIDGHPHDAIPPGVRIDLASCNIVSPKTTTSARRATCGRCVIIFETWSGQAKGRTRPPGRAELAGFLSSPPGQRMLDAMQR